jgi:hypothetical protein
MMVQKLFALSSPSRFAVRDLFDLHHLFVNVGVPSGDFLRQIETKILESAVQKVEKFSHSDFKEQVLPFLPEEMIRWYEDPQAFEKLKEEVQGRLMEVLL